MFSMYMRNVKIFDIDLRLAVQGLKTLFGGLYIYIQICCVASQEHYSIVTHLYSYMVKKMFLLILKL